MVMHVDRSLNPYKLSGRIFFTDDPSTALLYARDFDSPYGPLNEFHHPVVLRIDTTKEPELRRLLREGTSGEWYMPVGIFRLRHQPLVVAIGKTGWKEISKSQFQNI